MREQRARENDDEDDEEDENEEEDQVEEEEEKKQKKKEKKKKKRGCVTNHIGFGSIQNGYQENPLQHGLFLEYIIICHARI